MAIFFSGVSVVSLGFWVTSFAAVLLAIVQDTANGMDDVTGYPDWNIVDWVVTSMYFPAAAFVASCPAVLYRHPAEHRRWIHLRRVRSGSRW